MRRGIALVAAVIAAIAATLVFVLRPSSSHTPSTPVETRPHRTGETPIVARLRPARTAGPLLTVRDGAPAAIAVSAGYLAWEYEPSKGRPNSALMEGNRSTGKVRQLAPAVLPQFGLASTRRYVVYAVRRGAVSELRAVRHNGSGRVVLSRSLDAPVAARGELVAWVDELNRGAEQRVVVRNMATGREQIAARLPRCRAGKCYRIDAVTLADDGVVFTRGAVGTQPSLIVRRRFGEAQPTTAAVKNDPQPDLAPSSAGAVYYELERGWARWDFDAPSPSRTGVDPRHWSVVGYEHGRLLLRTVSPCRTRLIVRRPGKPAQTIPAPASAPGSPKDLGPLCNLLTGFAWQGRRLIVAWAVIPQITLKADTDVGVGGVVVETLVS
jgi:hypothetical protein